MSLALRDAKFELDASTAVSPNVVDRVGGMVFTNWPVSTDTDGVSFWNLDSSYLQRTGGGVLQESQAYTHAYVLKWRVSNSGWRTLLRHSFDHCVITRDGYRDLGMYSNRAGGFRALELHSLTRPWAVKKQRTKEMGCGMGHAPGLCRRFGVCIRGRCCLLSSVLLSCQGEVPVRAAGPASSTSSK